MLLLFENRYKASGLSLVFQFIYNGIKIIKGKNRHNGAEYFLPITASSYVALSITVGAIWQVLGFTFPPMTTLFFINQAAKDG